MSSVATYRSGTVQVMGSWMHYLEAGAGRPVLLLHGNPTSSFLWRHVLARVGDDGHRWVAPDLIGMGASGKPDLSYRLVDHIAHVDALIAALGLSDVVLVGHDWGVAIALDRLRRRPDDVRAVGFMEGHLHPLDGWDAFDESGRDLFQRLRTLGLGEQVVLEEDFFLDALLPAALPRSVSAEEMDVYREPYPDPASRRPLLQWARQVPVGGEPVDVARLVAAAFENLCTADVPKLLVHGDPGVLITSTTVARCQEDISHLTVADVGGPAGHFLPEDRPEQVVEALTTWVSGLP